LFILLKLVKLLFKLSFHKSLEGRKPGEKINKQTSMACVTIQSFMGLPVSTYYHAVKFDICHGCLLELGQKKYMCVCCHMSKKSRVGRSGLIFFFFFFFFRENRKYSFPVPESDSGI
jgi:hypothetical protein